MHVTENPADAGGVRSVGFWNYLRSTSEQMFDDFKFGLKCWLVKVSDRTNRRFQFTSQTYCCVTSLRKGETEDLSCRYSIKSLVPMMYCTTWELPSKQA